MLMSVEVTGKLYRATWRHHKQKWEGCTQCSLHKNSIAKILVRGKLPCDVLFIGEAPTQLEDICRQPFVGPPGKLLDKMIEDTEVLFRHAMTHVVACVPCGDEGETRPPTLKEAESCGDRLLETLMMTRAKGIVLLGRSAQGFSSSSLERYKHPFKHLHLVHPTQIIRQGGEETPLYRKEVRSLTTFVKRILRNG